MFAELQRLLEQSQAQLVEHITYRQKLAEEQARDLASRLEHELNMLKNRSSDLDVLANTQDKVLFLQVCIYIITVDFLNLISQTLLINFFIMMSLLIMMDVIILPYCFHQF